MELAIKIPDEMYKDIQKRSTEIQAEGYSLENAVLNGTPLPTAHEALNIKEDPDYYKNRTSLECIEAMEITFGKDAVIDFCRCNAWKYIWRWKNKNGKVDLDKAHWYLSMAYDMLSGSDNRMDIVIRMLHYVNAERGTEESDGNSSS